MEKENRGHIFIIDSGPGFKSELLEKNEMGIKKLFLENTSTKTDAKNKGYGCYLAYEISRKCGWVIDAINPDSGGSSIKIEMNNLFKE